MYRIEYSQRAQLDIQEISLRLEQDRGPDFAREYLQEMRASISTLSQWPMRTRERTELAAGQRALNLRHYMAFYRVVGNVVRVQRVVRGSRRITRRMLQDQG